MLRRSLSSLASVNASLLKITRMKTQSLMACRARNLRRRLMRLLSALAVLVSPQLP
jgi:hypothetical protein